MDVHVLQMATDEGQKLRKLIQQRDEEKLKAESKQKKLEDASNRLKRDLSTLQAKLDEAQVLSPSSKCRPKT